MSCPIAGLILNHSFSSVRLIVPLPIHGTNLMMSNTKKASGKITLIDSNFRIVVGRTQAGVPITVSVPTQSKSVKPKQPSIMTDTKPCRSKIPDQRGHDSLTAPKRQPVEVKLEEQQPCEEVKTEPNEPRILEPKQNVDGTCSLVESNSSTVVCKTPKNTFSLLVSRKRPSILRKPKPKQPCVTVDVKIEPDVPNIHDERPSSGPDKPRPVEVKLEEQQPCEEVKTEPNEPRILDARSSNLPAARKRRFVEVNPGNVEKTTLNGNIFPVDCAIVSISPSNPGQSETVCADIWRKLRDDKDHLQECVKQLREENNHLKECLEIELEKTSKLTSGEANLAEKLRSSEMQLANAREECGRIVWKQCASRDERLMQLHTTVKELQSELTLLKRSEERAKLKERIEKGKMKTEREEELLFKIQLRDIQLEKVREECRSLEHYRGQVGLQDDKVIQQQSMIALLKKELKNTRKREKHAKESLEKKTEDYDQLYQSTLPSVIHRKPYNEVVDSRTRKERFERFRLFLNDLCQTEELEVLNQFLYDYKMFREGDMDAGPVTLISAEQAVLFMRTFQISYKKIGLMRKMFIEMTSTNVLPSIGQIRKFIFKPAQAPSPQKEDDNSPNEQPAGETNACDDSKKETVDETGRAFAQDQYPLSHSQEDDQCSPSLDLIRGEGDE